MGSREALASQKIWSRNAHVDNCKLLKLQEEVGKRGAVIAWSPDGGLFVLHALDSFEDQVGQGIDVALHLLRLCICMLEGALQVLHS